MILLLTERALQRYLLGGAQYVLDENATFSVEDKGIRIVLPSGFRIFLAVLRGQDDIEVPAPAVIASCPTATQSQQGTLTHLVDVEITLRFPVDEHANQRHLLDGFQFSCDQLQSALYQDDLPEQVTMAADGFSCLWAPGPWTQASGWIDRLRTYQFKRQLLVTPGVT